jgi:hypothetical protein
MKANGDAQLEAFNRLYEHYLIQAQDIRAKFGTPETGNTTETHPH